MRLSDLKAGESGVIRRLHCGEVFGLRLQEMGFTVGEGVTCVRRAALSTPILYTVKGTQIALRTGDARKIEVT